LGLRILIPDAQFPGEPDIERAAAGPGAVIDVQRAHHPGEVPEASWRSCDGIILYHELSIGAAELARAPKLRIVVRGGVGFDNIDGALCGARGIAVCNTPDYGTTDVADTAIAMMLALLRGTAHYDDVLRQDVVGHWSVRQSPTIRRVRGLTFGVVGLGRIGTATARRARGFELDVVFYDPYLPDGAELALGFRRAHSLAELLGQADIVSLHTPLTEETRRLIDARAIAAMKPGTILVNTARGPVVDLDAVHDGLKSGKLAGAALDVLPDEPPKPGERLVAAWQEGAAWIRGRLLLAPHAAFYSAEGLVDIRRKSMATAVAFLRDGILRNCVNTAYFKGAQAAPTPRQAAR
jgi:phosphoglycerate dehydrogenase-like enzyme